MGSLLSVNKASKKYLYIIFTSTLCMIILFIVGHRLFNDSRIFSNVFIESVNVGGLTPEEAKIKIKEVFEREIDDFRLEFVYEDHTWQIRYEDLGIYYVFDDHIAKAYGIGRTGNYYERVKSIIRLRKNPYVIQLKPYYNLLEVDRIIEAISQSLNKAPMDAKIQRKNGRFIIEKEILGVEVEKDTFKNIITNISRDGTNIPIDIPVQRISPQITEENLSLIKDLIAQYSTNFNSQVKGRAENIRLAVNSINNSVLMPGEEFSFNESTGPRSVEGGYKEAPVIVKGEFVPDIGGGVCQVSTTLYQAVLRSDIEITSRRNHGLPVGYVPLGQDATVAYDYIDFKFKNNKDYPIYIESYISGDTVFVNLYGQKSNTLYIDLESKVVEVIEPKVEIKKDNTMYAGESKIDKEAKKGYRVVTYKVYLHEGKEVRREEISKDYYPPIDGIIIEGTKEL